MQHFLYKMFSIICRSCNARAKHCVTLHSWNLINFTFSKPLHWDMTINKYILIFFVFHLVEGREIISPRHVGAVQREIHSNKQTTKEKNQLKQQS